MGGCPRCDAQTAPDDRFCRNCGGYVSATPTFDDLEPPAETVTADGPRTDYADPVEFSSSPVPALDDGGPYQQPTVGGWSGVADGWFSAEQPPMPEVDDRGADPRIQWQPSFTSNDQYTLQPPFAPAGQQPYQAPYPYVQPEVAHYGPPPPQPEGKRRGLVVVGLIVVAVLLVGIAGVGGVLVLGDDGDDTAGPKGSSPAATGKQSPSGASSRAASQQAKKVDDLLGDAADGKSMLTTAYDQANSCKISPAQAEKRFRAAAANRRAIVRSARKLDTSKLERGPRIKSLMITMYSTSAKADDAFAEWARAAADNDKACVSANAKRTKGNQLSVRAGGQKQKFVKVWNPVAKQFGYSKRTKSGL